MLIKVHYNLQDYPEKSNIALALPNVACVGGPWLTPKAALPASDWGRITELAREASALGSW